MHEQGMCCSFYRQLRRGRERESTIHLSLYCVRLIPLFKNLSYFGFKVLIGFVFQPVPTHSLSGLFYYFLDAELTRKLHRQIFQFLNEKLNQTVVIDYVDPAVTFLGLQNYLNRWKISEK